MIRLIKPQVNMYQYITSHFEIAIDVKTIMIGFVLNNKYDKFFLSFFMLKLLFQSDLYITFQNIYMRKMVFFFSILLAS